MKAGVLRAPDDLVYAEVDDPVPAQGDMLLKVKAATICGTDIRIFRGRKTAGVRYPSVIGHEFAGEIADAGGHAAFKAGDKVCVCPAIPCGHCDNCKRGYENVCENLIAVGYEIDGAFAEYFRIPARAVDAGNVFPMPPDLTFEQAALAEPLACVINGQEQVNIGLGDNVVVLGAGPIGLLHVQLARHAGARHILVSQTSALRRRAALDAGADVAIDPASEDLEGAVKAMCDGQLADVAIVAIGVPRLANDAIRLVRTRGRVSLFAGFSQVSEMMMDGNAIHYRELTVRGSFGLSRRHFERAIDLLSGGRFPVESLLTHRFALSDIGAALAAAETGAGLKVAILP
ncbi:zinc-dependent dehydrogenase [soil metagenome]